MERSTVSIRFMLNGKATSVEVPGAMNALTLIRERLMLKGTKEGCGIGECGACTILVDGRAVNACLMLAAQLDGREVQTVEGLAADENLSALQEAFVAHHAVQCGFCTPGLLMSTQALLKTNPNPDQAAIAQAISGNICRCTGYQQIFASVAHAAGAIRGDGTP